MEKKELKKICLERCGRKIWSSGSGDFCTFRKQTITDEMLEEVEDLAACYIPKGKVGQKGCFCPECDGLIGHSDSDTVIFDCKLCHVCGVAYAGNMCHNCHFDKEEIDYKRWQAREAEAKRRELAPLGKVVMVREDGSEKEYDLDMAPPKPKPKNK